MNEAFCIESLVFDNIYKENLAFLFAFFSTGRDIECLQWLQEEIYQHVNSEQPSSYQSILTQSLER